MATSRRVTEAGTPLAVTPPSMPATLAAPPAAGGTRAPLAALQSFAPRSTIKRPGNPVNAGMPPYEPEERPVTETAHGHRIGWIGVGRMGRPLVTRLLDA